MIPLKLTLLNFMCYRDNVPTINFESIHTACISGSNGHGKSALIDAITWALWGQSRAASDDELVHSGQMETQVDFEFAVTGQRYGIIRKHARPKNQKSSGQTILEFHLITPEGVKVLTGDTVTQTQQKIIQVLHMDYDTFVNSAYIRQGHSNEFTRKRAGERKQVLSNILQLAVYDDLEERAKVLSKEQQNTLDQIEAVVGVIHEELVRRSEYQTEYEKAQIELKRVESETTEFESLMGSLRKDKELLENKKAQLTEIEEHLQEMKRNYDLWTKQAEQCRTRFQSYAEILTQRESIETGCANLKETRLVVGESDRNLIRFNTLKDTKHNLDIAVVKTRMELDRARAVAQNNISEMMKSVEKLPSIQQELQQLAGYLKKIDEAEQQALIKREKSQDKKSSLQWLNSEQTRLKTEIKEVEEKLKMLAHQEDATCPLCESELGPEGQLRIEGKYKTQKSALSEALQKNLIEIKTLSVEVIALDSEIKQTEDKIKHAREASQTKQGRLEKAAADTAEAAQKCRNERKTLEEIERHLESKDLAPVEQASLSKIEKEMAELAYDPQRHEQLKLQAAELNKFEELMRKLNEADRSISREKTDEEQACKTSKELSEKIENARQRERTLKIELDSMTGVTEELQKAEAEYQVRLAAQRQIREVMGGAKARLDRLDDLEKRLKEKNSQAALAVKQNQIYKDLAQAFGKKGLQAMLIEMAIPEIESEANRLLMRMTDNRMSIKLETQRTTKKGEIQETLDINISDELGTRNYEMFSGGESFRIDFAIRIALSKLLAHRAGAPLPTLIIDEGFGTQDTNGIEKIKEAITSIQDDFEKILVITHIADFKDAFPMQIEVVKTPEGSTVFLN
jgi:DNA repair protein SbcC/Rad50